MLFNMSQLHGYPTRSKNTDTSTNCNFAEQISKPRNDLVRNFNDLRGETINMKIIIKKTWLKTLR